MGSAITMQWPCDFRPAAITQAYDSATGQVRLAAPTGSLVRAGVTGRVVGVGENYAQIAAEHYTLTFLNLMRLSVQVGQATQPETLLGESRGPDSIALAVYQTVDPTALLLLPSAPQPIEPPPPITSPQPQQPSAPPPAPDKAAPLYIIATMNGVRIREKPIDGNPIGAAGTFDILEVLDVTASTSAKIGIEGEWLHIRKFLDGTSGYCAAQFFKRYAGPDPTAAPTPAVPGLRNILGMNLDIHNALGKPSAAQLGNLGWVRVKYNVSFNPDNNTYGNTDVNAAFNRLKPYLEQYTQAGVKVLVVFTHQLYGEGAGYHWPSMDTGKWNEFAPKFADFARRAAQLLAGARLVHAYQIWNEQDTNPAVARAAVPIPARDYANLLAQTIRAIRSVDLLTPIITGGHVGGPGNGSAYARATLSAMPDVRPDGLAVHPYGRGVVGHLFSPFGALDDEIRAYGALMPSKPVWFTEWGVLDQQGRDELAPKVLEYARGFMNIIRAQYNGQVAAAIWYAWADGMDNGYGLVTRDNRPKSGLFDDFLRL